MAPIELRNVSTFYHAGSGEIRALEDVPLDIEAGEFISTIGPPGSGKSTLMHGFGGLGAHPSETILQLFHQPSREGHPIALLIHDLELAAATPAALKSATGKSPGSWTPRWRVSAGRHVPRPGPGTEHTTL